MSEKEYIVTPNKGVDYAQSHRNDFSNWWRRHNNRTVDVADKRELLLTRNTYYASIEAEAEFRNDSRVTDVQLRSQDRDDIEIGHDAVQTANFDNPFVGPETTEIGVKLHIASKKTSMVQAHSLGGDFSPIPYGWNWCRRCIPRQWSQVDQRIFLMQTETQECNL